MKICMGFKVISEQKTKALEFFAQGREYYKRMEFEKAGDCFKNAMRIDPNDGPSKVYAARCQEFLENPPQGDWDGVYVMKTK
jgi:tetratricopeptide (TPR) repeat protein